MEIVIKLSDKYRASLLEGSLTNEQILEVYRAARKGVILPKGHGDLIDRKVILCDDCSCEQCEHTDECFKLLAPTIIEADKDYLEV